MHAGTNSKRKSPYRMEKYITYITALKIIHIKNGQRFMDKEISFHSKSLSKPPYVDNVIDLSVRDIFSRWIHHNIATEKVENFDMKPEELAYLCGERYLSDGHMTFLLDILNKAQKDIFCIFGNFVCDIETYCNVKK